MVRAVFRAVLRTGDARERIRRCHLEVVGISENLRLCDSRNSILRGIKDEAF